MDQERGRYIVFEIITELEEISKSDLLNSITRSLFSLHGELGASKTGIWLIEFDERKKKGIIRCSHKGLIELRTSLAVISQINKNPVIFHVLGISGTIKKAKEKFLI